MPTLLPEPPLPKKSKKRKLTQPEKPPSKKKAKSGTNSKPNGSHGTISNNNLRSAFARVAERRQQEIALLEPALLRGFLMDIRELTGKELPSLMAAKSSNSSSIKASRVAHDVRMLINAEYKKMSDEEFKAGIAQNKTKFQTIIDDYGKPRHDLWPTTNGITA